MPRGPQWNTLYGVAEAQNGFFTTQQGAAAGYSPQLLRKHIQAGRVARPQRGIYRLVHFPAMEHEELVLAWLWSERVGVISHSTALSLHDVSDVLPAHVHLTLPVSWRTRRLSIPAGVAIHHADVPASETTWFGAVPTTTIARTLRDCATSGLAPELLQQASRQSLARGLVALGELGEVVQALAPFGGIA